MEREKTCWVRNACGMKQYTLDNTEDRGVGADAQGQRENGNDGEERRVNETQKGLAMIGQEHAYLGTYLRLRRRGVRGSLNVMDPYCSLSSMRIASW